MDDDWIDDGEIDNDENLDDEIHLGDGTSAFFTESMMNDQSSTLKNIMTNADGDEKEARLFSRKIKKEQERMAKKFKIITAAEFEASFNQPASTAPNGRQVENDSWCANAAANASASNEAMTGITT